MAHVLQRLWKFCAACLLGALALISLPPLSGNTAPLAAPAAAISLSTPYSQDFNSLASSGTGHTWTDDVTLEGWYATRPTYNAGTGSSTTGALYSFGSTGSTERALGSLASGGTGTIYYGVRLVNDTGATITAITVTYTGEQWRASNVTATQKLDFAYQIGASLILTSGTWTDANTLDFVSPIYTGTAGALDGNASTNRVVLSDALTLSLPPGQEIMLRWSDIDDTGSDHGLAIDDLTVTAYDAPPIVISTSPADTAGNVLTTTNLLINFSEPVTVTASWYGITCTISGEHTAVVSGGPISFTLDPEIDFAAEETCTTTVYAAQVTDQDRAPDPMTADYTWSFTTRSQYACPAPANTVRAIGAVQGITTTSPFNGQKVTVQGTVTGYYTPTGFFIQSSDGNPATSDGLFISSTVSVNVGAAVQVNGTVNEANILTQLTSTSLDVCGLPEIITPTLITLPVPISTTLEPYENMLVTIPQTLTVDQNFYQGRYGQVTLSSDGRLFNPTNGNGLGDTADLNLRRMIVLDDGSFAQNPDPIPYIGEDNTLRAGDVITDLSGILDYGQISSSTAIRHYRLQPTSPVTFTRVNARSAVPPDVGAPPYVTGSLKVASFNVLNYFNGDGQGGGFPTSRGATTLLEFERQRTKIITALVSLDADVVGLMEIENDGAGSLSAVQDLVNGLNAATAPDTYAFVVEPAPDTDDIKVSLIYRAGRVTPIGAAQNYQTDTTAYTPLYDRPPLVQLFQVPHGQQFFVIVNHFKSKTGCPASGADVDLGQGCWNAKRVAQAGGLLTLINSLSVTSTNVIVIGDLNAYGAEDPIGALQAGGLIDQVAAREPAPDRYSYVIDGQAGYLDHALATTGFAAYLTGVRHWHINADEPSVIDYNTEFKPPDLYTPTAYRASDHDPVLIGLNFPAPPPAPNLAGSSKQVNTSSITAGNLLTYTLIVSNSGDAPGTFALTDTLAAMLNLISAPDLTLNDATLTGSGVVETHTQQTFTITVRVTANFSGTISNTAYLSGDGFTYDLNAPAVQAQVPVPVKYGVYLPLIQK